MKKHYTIFTLIAFFVFLISFKNAYASHITFSNIRVENAISSGAQIKWTTNIASDSRAVWGTAPGNYTANIDVGNVLNYTVPGLTPNIPYYFVVAAYNPRDDEQIVITVYEPDPALWLDGFRRRKQ